LADERTSVLAKKEAASTSAIFSTIREAGNSIAVFSFSNWKIENRDSLGSRFKGALPWYTREYVEMFRKPLTFPPRIEGFTPRS
jgi:hypothetical protein